MSLLKIIRAGALACVILSSCVTQKQRAKICATCPRSDSASIVKKESIIYRDSLIFISLAGDTVKILSPCDSGKLKPFHEVKKRNGLVTTVSSNGKVIVATCAADSLLKVIEKIRADHFASINSEKQDTIIKECNKRHHTAWDSICNWGFPVMIILILLYIVLKRFLKSIPFP